jgi:drug/metabolite transporter (DMT)-like permease
MPVTLPAATTDATTTTSLSTSIVVSVAVLVFILYRQVQVRRTAPNMVLPLVLTVLGVAFLAQGSNRPTGAKIGILIALLAVDAVGLGAVRAWTVKLWRDSQGALRQGTWVTVVLWLVGLGIHEGVDALAHIPDSSTLLYLGVTLAAQQAVLQARVNRLEQQPGAPGPNGPTGQPGPGPVS